MYRTLLVPLDNSALAEQALPTAESLARGAGAAIELVYVHEPRPSAGYPDAPWNAARRTLEDSYVHGVADEVRSGAGVPIAGRVATGPAADAICDRAVEAGADLIVMTTHGRTGVSRAWLGSVADTVVRQSSVPVLLLRPEYQPEGRRQERPPFARILVPLDGTPGEEAILEPAVELAKLDHGSLILVSIVPPVPMMLADATSPFSTQPTIIDNAATANVVQIARQRVESLAARLAELGVASVETTVIVSEFPAQAIINATHACSADVVAMATTGGGMSRLLIGSIADKVMRASFLPLLLLRPSVATIEEGRAAHADVHFPVQPEPA